MFVRPCKTPYYVAQYAPTDTACIIPSSISGVRPSMLMAEASAPSVNIHSMSSTFLPMQAQCNAVFPFLSCSSYDAPIRRSSRTAPIFPAFAPNISLYIPVWRNNRASIGLYFSSVDKVLKVKRFQWYSHSRNKSGTFLDTQQYQWRPAQCVFAENPPQSYRASPAIWDQTVLRVTRHR